MTEDCICASVRAQTGDLDWVCSTCAWDALEDDDGQAMLEEVRGYRKAGF